MAEHADTLVKKCQALCNLHREQQSRLREQEETEKEVIALRERLAMFESENYKPRQESERLRQEEQPKVEMQRTKRMHLSMLGCSFR